MNGINVQYNHQKAFRNIERILEIRVLSRLANHPANPHCTVATSNAHYGIL